MAIAKKCDRCGTLYDLYNIKDNAESINGFQTLNIDESQQYCCHGPYDLCPSCSTELIDWFNRRIKDNG